MLFLASCGDRAADRSQSPPPLADAEAVLTYGHGPSRDGTAVYQPDVILIEGGPAAIRAASSNGLTWTIDRKAPCVSALAVGKVMFATSRAVGRVSAITDEGAAGSSPSRRSR